MPVFPTITAVATTTTQDNIILTGFMATGKTTVGRLLAERLGYLFVDTDAMIADRMGPVAEIFATAGEGAFRDAERLLAAELATMSGYVIATGGRMLLDDANATVLAATGRIFCLRASPEEVLARVAEDSADDRPLLAGADRLGRIVELLRQRAEGYAQFEQVETEGRSPDAVVADILRRLGHGRGAPIPPYDADRA